ncbi:transmembrane protein 42-like [Lytechinus pictus]|uniref:transmembrane protein 42-like n=1 Tax=Lytechinus pictus TaxID=7653 RepID=UPI0030B9F1E7
MGVTHGLILSVCAGVCAATASLCAKLAMSGEEVAEFCSYLHEIMQSDLVPPCSMIAFAMRIGVFSLIFIFNGLMWTLFTKSMQLCPASLHATMTNSSSNLIFSGLMGQLLFGETLSLKWWFGVSLIIVGLFFVNRGQQTSNDSTPQVQSHLQEDKKDR